MRADRKGPTPLQGIVALGFVGAGTLHFAKTDAYVKIMPGYLPLHRELVLASGVAEIVGGAGVLAPRTRNLARWWLIALLVAVFPANIEMALHPERFRAIPPVLLWLRLPLQAGAVALVWRATGDGPSRAR
ncbi:MAG: DoxX family protein [Thermoleophilaceae bacterium]